MISELPRASFRYRGCWFFLLEVEGEMMIGNFQDTKRKPTYKEACDGFEDIALYLSSIFAINAHGQTWVKESLYNLNRLASDHASNVIDARDVIIFNKSVYETAIAIRSRLASFQDKKRPGYVYLLQSVSGHYKIGRSVDPSNRLKTFGVLLPFEVEYVCLIKTDDCVALEKRLHQMFDDFRVNGEWFQLAPDDVEYIKSLAAVKS